MQATGLTGRLQDWLLMHESGLGFVAVALVILGLGFLILAAFVQALLVALQFLGVPLGEYFSAFSAV
ncbi:MAG: hypothetical protein L0338_15000 [Acidobacteria bacterium]|nr:hypothetical protein [Acidobacteriota bacterium]